ncbi:MAG: class I SAM-dependent methyltransferase [Proteobacteria bacterium]|nr:class I SAM-dependent methyltransferase [Pseudomonadota bacterium]MDA0913814.1 class I SAM-dependent methyltransferase [Pseudomonadota bacterium]MDA1032315.1 class I SAM-dependent methyltransferase [Pseudomonadota bacterium]
MTSSDNQEWQGRVGKSWASEWQRTDRSFRMLTSELDRRVAESPYANLLDVGCGAGELSLVAAQARPEARVTGVDISPDLVDVALLRSAGVPNVRFEIADAASWRSRDGVAFDLQVSRHGVMFFDHPVAAFTNLRAISAPGASLIFSCFRSVEENPFFGLAGKLVDRGVSLTDPHAPGPFAFADAERVHGILSDAGWCNVSIVPFDFQMIAGSGEDPISDAVSYFSRIGPAARAVSLMDDMAKQSFRVKLEGFVRQHLSAHEVALGAAAWIVTATRD